MTGRIGFMQGRLCAQVGNEIQAFPWRDWEAEFPLASALGIRAMEWTLDHARLYDNPLMTDDGRSRIRLLQRKHRVAIPSLTGDCFMQSPFWKEEGADTRAALKSDFLAICEASSALGIRMLVVPIVDNGRIDSLDQEDELVGFFLEHQAVLSKLGIRVAFESDFPPAEVRRFIDRLPTGSFGINYDIGNSAALGYNPADEFAAYGDRVLNVHIKDRILGGSTVPLGQGAANFDVVFAEIAAANYTGNFILQTARATDGDHSGAVYAYHQMAMKWIRKSRPGAMK